MILNSVSVIEIVDGNCSVKSSISVVVVVVVVVGAAAAAAAVVVVVVVILAVAGEFRTFSFT